MAVVGSAPTVKVPLGLTGATAATRYVGGTGSGAPVSGTFAVGDFAIDQTGFVWICTAAGTPGTWVSGQASGGVSNSGATAIASGTGGVSGGITFATNSVVRASLNFDGTGSGFFGGAIKELSTISGGGDVNGNIGIGSALANLITGPAVTANVALGNGGIGVHQDNLNQVTTGFNNTAIGAGSLTYLTTGQGNTALGPDALVFLVSGNNNIAIGAQAAQNLLSNASGNTVVGSGALFNATAGQNDAFGLSALLACTTGTTNVAVGANTLKALTTATGCTAVGNAALNAATGIDNTGLGFQAGLLISTGTENVAVGRNALDSLTTGVNNTAVGAQAGHGSTGSSNTMIGQAAGFNAMTGSGNIVVGGNAGRAVVTGSNGTFLGFGAGRTSSTDHDYMTLLGYQTIGTAAGVVAIGVDHNGTSASASGQDYFVLGTSAHKLFMPGLPTADPHVVGQLWANSGVVTVSAG